MDKHYLDSYVAFLRKFLRVRRPLRVVFDSSNGTTGPLLRELFRANQLIHCILINSASDGRFPAHGPNPLAPGTMDKLSRAVRRARADLGVIFDADGDRVFFTDDRGRSMNPDAVAVMIGRDMPSPVLLDVRSGYLAHDLLRAAKKRVLVSRVGHYFIKKRMRAERIPFAAEFSGHYYFKDFFYCDSGILAAIKVVNAVSHLSPPAPHFSSLTSHLSYWVDSLPRYYSSGEMNFRIKDKKGTMERMYRAYRSQARRVSRMDGLKMEFGPRQGDKRPLDTPRCGSGQAARGKQATSDREYAEKEWWLLVRPSNTEDLLRLTVEAKDRGVFRARVKEVRALIR